MILGDPDVVAIRKRSGMYVGDDGECGLLTCLWEVVGNSVDEFIAGRCKRIDIALTDDGGFSVTDDGGGIRPTIDLEAALTTFHRTPSLEPNRPHRHVGRFGGLGLVVINALAERLHIVSTHPQRTTDVTASRGKILETEGKSTLTRGTRLTFVPDRQIFRPVRIGYEHVMKAVRATCAILRSLEVTVSESPRIVTGADGLLALLDHERGLAPPFLFCEQHEGTRIDVAASWKDWGERSIQSFANLQPTDQHGTHVDGFMRAVTRALGGPARDAAVLSLVIAVDRDAITFSGPTKGKLANPEVLPIVKHALAPALKAYFEGPGHAVRNLLRPNARSKRRA